MVPLLIINREIEITLPFYFPPEKLFCPWIYIPLCWENVCARRYLLLFKSQKHYSCHQSEGRSGLCWASFGQFEGDGQGPGGSQAALGWGHPLWGLWRTENSDFRKGADVELLCSHEAFLWQTRVKPHLVGGLNWRTWIFPDILLGKGRSWEDQWSGNYRRQLQSTEVEGTRDRTTVGDTGGRREPERGCGFTYVADGDSEPW